MTQHALPPRRVADDAKTREEKLREQRMFNNVKVSIDANQGRTDHLTVDQMRIRYEPVFEEDGTQKHLVHFSGVVREARVSMHDEAPQETAENPMYTLVKKYRDCSLCRLGMEGTCYRKQVVFGDGNFINPSILIIGEAPGPDEDEQGRPFVGVTGQLLRNTLQQVGVHVDRDCFITNSVLCLPYDEQTRKWRAPVGDEILACRQRLQEQIRLISRDLKVVLLLGKRAVATFLKPQLLRNGELQTDADWNRKIRMKEELGWYSGILPWGTTPKVYSTWHPSYIARAGKSRASMLSTEWKLDLQAVADFALRGQFTDPRVMKA